jgi:hypothetical protein
MLIAKSSLSTILEALQKWDVYQILVESIHPNLLYPLRIGAYLTSAFGRFSFIILKAWRVGEGT